MKKILLPLALCFATVACFAQSKTIYNLDFEQLDAKTGMPAGWGMGNISTADLPTDSTAAAYILDKSVKQNGNYSLLIDWSKGYKEWTASDYVIRQVFKGSKITLTGYVKTENVTDGAGLWMRLDGADGNVLGFDNMQSRFIKGTTDWKEYSITLAYDPDEVKDITLGGLITGTGKMWMDNLHITIDDKDIAEAEQYTPAPSKCNADRDTTFANGSGIKSIALNADKVKDLANLGMLWGFIKYYHARVSDGAYNMDAALFRVLPSVLAAKSSNEANAVMEKWVDGFGKPAVCKKCEEEKPEDVKLKPDYGMLFATNNFPKSMTDKLEFIKKNRSAEEGKHYYIGAQPGIGNPIFQHEASYSKITYPDAGMRLLSLYRYWNMVQYFFPYRHLIGEDWNKVLPEFIPAFCSASDTLDYQLACLKLIARVHDTHANIWGGASALSRMKGQLTTPIQAKFMQEKLVVTGYYTTDPELQKGIKIGDVIERIDGVKVEELVHKYLPTTAASNFETQLRDLPDMHGWLFRSNKPDMEITYDHHGHQMVMNVKRISFENAKLQNAPTVAYKILKDNIGYIYPALLKEHDIDSIKIMFANTKGIVIDMRCYPATFMPFTYGEWLKPSASPFVKFTFGDIDYPGYFIKGDGPENGTSNADNYKGKLVIIVDAGTQSQAEYTTMALSTVPGAQVVGSTTAGADGNVSEIILPGGIRTIFSGIGILYPDGAESQRKGVKIDKVVNPTIQGIRNGKDEQLEEALKLING